MAIQEDRCRTVRTLIVVLASSVMVGTTSQEFTSQFRTDDLHFSPFGGQPHFILDPGHRLVLKGEEAGEQIELTVTALNQTREITLPSSRGPRTIHARVVEEREVVNGELAEVSRFWYSCGIETGDVYYFGEEVDFYLGGEIVGHRLLWEAGLEGALPGIIMPRTFLLGARYYQNQAPTALDGAENLAAGVTVVTPAGRFSNCIQVLETDGLRPDLEPATKTYAPGVGLVDDDGHLLLAAFGFGAAGLPTDATFVPFSNHPYLPLSPGRRLVLKSSETNKPLVLTITVLDETRSITVKILGRETTVSARVVEERKSMDGQLLELSRAFLAQCVETGDVHLLGKEVDHYNGGLIPSHEGSWLAGLDAAEAGIFLPANLTVGAQYAQGGASSPLGGLAVNSASGVTVVVPAGTFANCIRITVPGALGTGGRAREMIYAPGVGLVSDGPALQLTSFTDDGLSGGRPVLVIQDAVHLRWLLTDQWLPPQTSVTLQDWLSIPRSPTRADGRYELTLPRVKAKAYFRLAAP
jgi:hypothetical protein